MDADEPSQRQRADQRPARRHELRRPLWQNDNPLSLGTDLNAKIFSYSLAATMTLTPNLVMDVVGGATTPHTYQQPNGPRTVLGRYRGHSECLPGQGLGAAPDGDHGIYIAGRHVGRHAAAREQRVQLLGPRLQRWSVPGRGQPWLDQGQPQREVRRRHSLADT